MQRGLWDGPYSKLKVVILKKVYFNVFKDLKNTGNTLKIKRSHRSHIDPT